MCGDMLMTICYNKPHKFDKIKIIWYNKVRLMEKRYVVCPQCGKKLFRVEKDSIFNNIYLWCKKCCKEIKITEPKSHANK